MKLLLATNHLGLGGSESYLLTVAEQLLRLGHEPQIYVREPGAGADVARERGLMVVAYSRLPEECDAILAQDAGVSLELASRYPEARQVFVAHSEIFDLQLPPQLDGAIDTVVALNDRVADRLRSLAVEAEVVRLRQPIDIERFVPGGELPSSPRRALLLTNNPVGDRLQMIESACSEVGLELARVGGDAGQSANPRAALNGADIVIGYGRSVLEAMACGRAAYVYDRHGGDGWVTADSYPQIEAGGFGGRTGRAIVDAVRLVDDLQAYAATMGPVNHDLVMAHHRANVHAQQIVDLLRRADPSPRLRGPLDEMARLVRLEWRARVDAQALAVENARLQNERGEHERAVEGLVLEASRAAAEETALHYARSWSWRLTAPFRRAGRLLGRAMRGNGDNS